MKLIKNLFKLAGAIIVAGVLVWILAALPLGTVSDACRDIKNTILKYVDPVAMVKDVASDLVDKSSEMLSSEDSTVKSFLEKFKPDSWKTIDLPSNAVQKKTVGDTVKITLYRDPGYITITTKSTSITVEVPESMQKVVAILG